MPKITSSNTKPLFIKYVLKIFLSTIISVFVLCSLSSLIVLKTDISLDILPYIAAVITILSSVIITIISVKGFKNNYLPLSLISVFPLLIFTIVNFYFNKTNSIIILIKIAGIILSAIIVALIKSCRKSR